MNLTASELNNGISALSGLYGLAKKGIVKAKTRFAEPLRVEKLTDDFFSQNQKVGAVVTVRGVLSRYGTIFRPSAYVSSIPRDVKNKKKEILSLTK
jgi:hypothetical protein